MKLCFETVVAEFIGFLLQTAAKVGLLGMLRDFMNSGVVSLCFVRSLRSFPDIAGSFFCVYIGLFAAESV